MAGVRNYGGDYGWVSRFNIGNIDAILLGVVCVSVGHFWKVVDLLEALRRDL